MGLRGPAPTPKSVKEARGSWRGKYGTPELEADGSIPQPPKAMKGEALAEWQRVVGELGPKGALSAALDHTALVLLCEAWAEYRALDRKAARLVTGSGDWQRVIDVRNDAFKRWNDLSKRFGLTPADRPRVKLPTKKADDSGKGRFFNANANLKLA